MRDAQLPASAPLVIALHGTTMDGALMRKFTGYEFDSMADTHGFAVFYPDGYKRNCNDCLTGGAVAATLENVDDVGFILALIGKAQSEFKIDPMKVYFVGYSNGGQLAMTLATLSPGPAASMAIFGADLSAPDNSTCPQDSRTPPIMIVAGTDDPISPYNGGAVNSIFGFQNKGTVVSAPATADAFARRNGIDTPPSEEMLPHRDPRDPTSVQRLIWRKDSEPNIVLYSVRGGGHTVPQPIFRYPRWLGRSNRRSRRPHTSDCIFLPVTLRRWHRRDDRRQSRHQFDVPREDRLPMRPPAARVLRTGGFERAQPNCFLNNTRLVILSENLRRLPTHSMARCLVPAFAGAD